MHKSDFKKPGHTNLRLVDNNNDPMYKMSLSDNMGQSFLQPCNLQSEIVVAGLTCYLSTDTFDKSNKPSIVIVSIIVNIIISTIMIVIFSLSLSLIVQREVYHTILLNSSTQARDVRYCKTGTFGESFAAPPMPVCFLIKHV